MITEVPEVCAALSVIEDFEASRPYDFVLAFKSGELFYEDITEPNTPLKDKKPNFYQFCDSEYRWYRGDSDASIPADTDEINASSFTESETIVIPDDDDGQQNTDAGETTERSYVELRDVCSGFGWKLEDSRESVELSPEVLPGYGAESDGNLSSDPESDAAPCGIPTIVHDAGNSQAASASEADMIKQRMKDKIRGRRESEGVGDIDFDHLFEPPKQYELTPEERAKEEKRKQRNRVSAEKSRRKRIEMEKTVEQEYEEEEKKNAELSKEVRELKACKALLDGLWSKHSSCLQGNIFPPFDSRPRTCSASNSESELSLINPTAPQSALTSGYVQTPSHKRSAPLDEASSPDTKVPRLINNNGQLLNTSVGVTTPANFATPSSEFVSGSSQGPVMTRQTSVANMSPMTSIPRSIASSSFYRTENSDSITLQDVLSTSQAMMTSLSAIPTPTSFSGFTMTTASSFDHPRLSKASLPAKGKNAYLFTDASDITSNHGDVTCAVSSSVSRKSESQQTTSSSFVLDKTAELKAIEDIKQKLMAEFKSFT